MKFLHKFYRMVDFGLQGGRSINFAVDSVKSFHNRVNSSLTGFDDVIFLLLKCIKSQKSIPFKMFGSKKKIAGHFHFRFQREIECDATQKPLMFDEKWRKSSYMQIDYHTK